jgi:hypothetical protein
MKIKSDILKIPILDKQGLRLKWKILGFDDDGNVYVLEGYFGKYPMLLKEEIIQVVSRDGVLQSEIVLDVDACYDNGLNQHFFSVDKKGNIYQLLTTKTGVCVFKWIKD